MRRRTLEPAPAMPYAVLSLVFLILASFSGCSKPQASPLRAAPAAPPPAAAGGDVVFERAPPERHRVIVLVWDGLRPDSIDPTLTPELARLRDQRGTNFRNHHSVYPTLTMMNAAAIATGTLAGTHGFYGNSEYQPGPAGKNAKGADVDYSQPFFSEDHAILQALDAFYRASGSSLLRVQTLFELAHAAGLETAAIGKAGPAFLQDYRASSEHGVILDENVVLPRSFAVALQEAGFDLPKNTLNQPYPEGPLALAPENGDPTAPADPALVTLADGVTPDPRATSGSPHKARNAYLMRVFTDYVLPEIDPALSVVWLRDPDSTEHAYGPGSPSVRDALERQDILLGDLLATLDRLGRTATTDLIVVSDHGHSTVASDPQLYPLRELTGAPDGHGKVGAVKDPGYVVSGDIRTADWLRRAGFQHVYDGAGCVYDPVLAGIDARGHVLHPTYEDARCGKKRRASTRSYELPAGELASDAIIAAANGGSEYFYLPSQDPQLVRKLVTALQERAPFGPLFVRSLYGEVPGTLPLARIGMETPQSASPPMPDVVVSFDWDDAASNAASAGAPGSELSSPQGHRGAHGSFSPVDVHAVLVASGPSFRKGFADDYPSSNLDLAPTLATLLGLSMPHAEGRALDEALVAKTAQYEVAPFEERVGPVPLERACKLDDPDCKKPVRGLEYSWTLNGQTLATPDGAHRWVYLDRAKVARVRADAESH